MNNFFEFIRSRIRKTGYDINYYGKTQLLKQSRIDLVLDVGANQGQFAKLIRNIGYKGLIISYEPLENAFQILKKNSLNDKNWEVFNFGLGHKNGIFTINEARNSYSSSLLEISERHLNEAKDSDYVSKYEIKIKRIDDFFNKLRSNYHNIFLKIDTQGYEEKVLLGASKSLKHIKIVQLEVSFEELYKGEKLFLDICNFMDELGFRVTSLEPGFISKKSGMMLQSDIIFLNKNFSL